MNYLAAKGEDVYNKWGNLLHQSVLEV